MCIAIIISLCGFKCFFNKLNGFISVNSIRYIYPARSLLTLQPEPDYKKSDFKYVTFILQDFF